MGQNFEITKTLPVGIYHYRFIVDGYFTYAPELPWAFDNSGYGYNILDLQVIYFMALCYYLGTNCKIQKYTPLLQLWFIAKHSPNFKI